MVRGIVPRQPAKTGRHEGARSVTKTGGLRPGRPGQRLGPTPVKRSATAAAKATPNRVGKGYNPLAPGRIAEILKRLDQLYPDATCALTHKSAWELLVATILSAQSTDLNVNRVTPELFRKYPTVADFAALTREQLEPDVRSTGFFRNKSKSVVGAAKRIVSEFGGQVPDDIDKLLTLPGVARKTANVVLGTWFRQGGRRSRGHPRYPHRAPFGTHQEYGCAKNRAGPDESDPAREVDPVLPSDHLAWTQVVHRATAEMRGLRTGKYLSRRR